MSDRVTVTIEDGIADVRLNRPDKLNAIDLAMFQALADTGDGLHADRSLRAVVLSGEGRSFCAGLDLSAMTAMANPPESPAGDSPVGTLGAACRARSRTSASRPCTPGPRCPCP